MGPPGLCHGPCHGPFALRRKWDPFRRQIFEAMGKATLFEGFLQTQPGWARTTCRSRTSRSLANLSIEIANFDGCLLMMLGCYMAIQM